MIMSYTNHYTQHQLQSQQQLSRQSSYFPAGQLQYQYGSRPSMAGPASSASHTYLGTNFGRLSPTGSPHSSRSSVSVPPSSSSSASTIASVASGPTNPKAGLKRARVTGRRLEVLLREFLKNTNPTPEQRRLIALDVNLSERSVRIWFQNKRAKTRKEQREKEFKAVAASPMGEDDGKCIPAVINDYYTFIHACSVTVGQWQRVKQDAALDYYFIPQLDNLSPRALEKLMSDPLDLAIVLSKKDNEINYFFTSYNDGQKILFRVFFALEDVSSTSLLPSAVKSSAKTGDFSRNSFNHELIIFLKRSPKFSVYFTKSNTNTWTMSDDFSIDRQVKDAYFGEGGKNIPHRIIGRTDPLRLLHREINMYTSKNMFKTGAFTELDQQTLLNLAVSEQQPQNAPSFDTPALSNYNFPSTLTPCHSHSQSTSSIYSLNSPAQTPGPNTYISPDFYQFHTNPGGNLLGNILGNLNPGGNLNPLGNLYGNPGGNSFPTQIAPQQNSLGNPQHNPLTNPLGNPQQHPRPPFQQTSFPHPDFFYSPFNPPNQTSLTPNIQSRNPPSDQAPFSAPAQFSSSASSTPLQALRPLNRGSSSKNTLSGLYSSSNPTSAQAYEIDLFKDPRIFQNHPSTENPSNEAKSIETTTSTGSDSSTLTMAATGGSTK